MKIGVALSGCSLGGMGAYAILRELKQSGLEIGMVSACCIPAAAAMLYASGGSPQDIEIFLDEVKEQDMDTAVETLSSLLHTVDKPALPALSVNAAEVGQGTIVSFTNGHIMNTRQVKTYPLTDAYDALSATISPLDGLASYPYRGMKLCDYAVWHGCPVHPLRMWGMDRVLSLSFSPELPQTPHQALVGRRLAETSMAADAHITLSFPSGVLQWEDIDEIATSKWKSCISQIYSSLLFPKGH